MPPTPSSTMFIQGVVDEHGQHRPPLDPRPEGRVIGQAQILTKKDDGGCGFQSLNRTRAARAARFVLAVKVRPDLQGVGRQVRLAVPVEVAAHP